MNLSYYPVRQKCILIPHDAYCEMLLLFGGRGRKIAQEVWGVRVSRLQEYGNFLVESDVDTQRRIEGSCTV